MTVQAFSDGSCDRAADCIPAGSVPLPTRRSVRRNLLNEVLGAQLERICVEALADFVLLIQADPATPASGTVLASAGVDWMCQFLPNEPIHFDPYLPNAPTTIDSLNCWSAMRPCHLSFGFSTIVPWSSRTTSGWLIITNSNPPEAAHLTNKTLRYYQQQLRRIYVDAGLRATNKLRLDIARATRAMVELDLEDH
jgi:hypothetical protein